MLNITQIPSQRVPVVDLTTGLMTREWFRFFDYINTMSPHADTYTATVLNEQNIAVTSLATCQYVQINQFVIVSGTFTASPIISAPSSFQISLPVSSTFTDSVQATGVMSVDSSTSNGNIIAVANGYNTLQLQLENVQNGLDYSFIATYQVL